MTHSDLLTLRLRFGLVYANKTNEKKQLTDGRRRVKSVKVNNYTPTDSLSLRVVDVALLLHCLKATIFPHQVDQMTYVLLFLVSF